MLVHRGGTPEIDACKSWVQRLLTSGDRIIIPEICDYEVRRELLRIGAKSSIERLDVLVDGLEYLPLTTEMMRKAAAFWAQTRAHGRPTADPHALDGDVILAAQAIGAGVPDVLVATTNTVHLDSLVRAALWSSI
jgi:predicted nucleic acid-binding protein